jgi:4'-phosphopantetheinyl transferase EntD
VPVPIDHLWPEELVQISDAISKRQLEYSSVRWCAREALKQLGHPPVAIVNGPQRDPGWPQGIVGSLTHCTGCYAAAVARQSDCLAIGIDAEQHQPLPHDILSMIASPVELQMLQQLMECRPGIHWGTLLFSIKESIFKAWFPLTRRWLDFHQATVRLKHNSTTFSVKLARGHSWPSGSQLQGNWYINNGLLLSTLVITP